MVKKMLSGTHGSEQGDMLVLLHYNPQRDNNHPMVTIKAQECCSICLGGFFFSHHLCMSYSPIAREGRLFQEFIVVVLFCFHPRVSPQRCKWPNKML